MLLPYNSQIPALLPAVDVGSCDYAFAALAVDQARAKADGDVSVLGGYPAGELVEQGISWIALQHSASGQQLSSAVVGAVVRQTGIEFGDVWVLFKTGDVNRADKNRHIRPLGENKLHVIAVCTDVGISVHSDAPFFLFKMRRRIKMQFFAQNMQNGMCIFTSKTAVSRGFLEKI